MDDGQGPDDATLSPVEREVRKFLPLRQRGEIDLDTFWKSAQASGGDVHALAGLVKADLQCRFLDGEAPSAAEYLARFPELRGETDRVLSLVYEEFCLLEENGKRVDPATFCDRYPEWKNSVASQLRYHKEFSKVLRARISAPVFPAIGGLFDQFSIVSELGRGGAARVYLAEDLSLANRQVVLKVSLDRGTEHEVLASLRHDHIVPVLSVSYDGDTLLRGLCLEYRPGLALDEVIRRLNLPAGRPAAAEALWKALEQLPTPPPLRTKVAPGAVASVDGEAAGPMTVSPGAPGWSGFPANGRYDQGVAWVGATLAEALHHGHQQRIFHRDVKPANVLLTYDDGPQLLDFNLAYDPRSVSQAEAALNGGTLPYMAPEQLSAFLDPRRWVTVGASADIYSLGLLLRELITGTPPEAPEGGLPLREAIQELLDARPAVRADLRANAPETSHALETVIGRALAHDPDGRYQSAAELAEDLRRVAHRLPLKFARNPSWRERLADSCRRHRVAAAAAAAAVLIAASGSAIPNWDRWFVPVEQRAAFAEAQRSGLEGRPEVAVAALVPLAKEAPTNPLVNFHLGVELIRLKNYARGSAHLLAALLPPEGFEELKGRAFDEPALVGMAESAGVELLDHVPPRPRPGQDWSTQLSAAEHAFAFVLAVEPTRSQALKGTANLAERREEFPRAVEVLTSLIDQSPHPAGVANAEVGKLRSNRARASIQWAHADLDNDQAPPADLEMLRERLSLAFLDLDFARRSQRTEDPKRLVADNYLRASGNLARGTLLERESKHAEAHSTYEEARESLAWAWPYVGETSASLALRDQILAGLRRLEARDVERPTTTIPGTAE